MCAHTVCALVIRSRTRLTVPYTVRLCICKKKSGNLGAREHTEATSRESHCPYRVSASLDLQRQSSCSSKLSRTIAHRLWATGSAHEKIRIASSGQRTIVMNFLFLTAKYCDSQLASVCDVATGESKTASGCIHSRPYCLAAPTLEKTSRNSTSEAATKADYIHRKLSSNKSNRLFGCSHGAFRKSTLTPSRFDCLLTEVLLCWLAPSLDEALQ